MNLLERFEKEKENRTYRRIDDKHNLDWYLGYNEKKQKTLVLIIKGSFIEFDSTQIIDVKLEKRTDNKLMLSFSLIDEDYLDIYLKLCEDIIENSRNIEQNILENILLRWNMWKATFKNVRNTKLTENEIKGLIGELICLNDIIIPKYGIERAIKCWQGPLKYHKDFEIDDDWYEVKTISDYSLTIKINSLQQLENKENKNGKLDVIILKDTNKENKNHITISKIIDLINSKINDLNLKIEFWDKLSFMNYSYNKEYEKYVYELYRLKQYNIDNNEFPRITSNEIKDGIVKVSYEIQLDSIKKFLYKEF